VTVSDKEKTVQTAGEGTYALHRVLGRPGQHVIPRLTYSKEGYITRDFAENQVGEEGLVVVMERQVALEGHVLGPDGQPVKNFAVYAGPSGASPDYVNLQSAERIVNDTRGRFKLWLNREGRTWVSVRAQGYANWEDLTNVPRSGASVIVRLETGFPLAGRILAPPGGLARLEAWLVPRRHPSDGRGFGSGSEVVDWTTRKTTVDADGNVRFDHVRPDRYTLLLSGPGVTSRRLALDVSGGGLDLGQVRLAGRGRIRGQAFKSKDRGGGAEVFSTGKIQFAGSWDNHEEIEFLCDEDGRFSVGGVPIGRVSVGFPWMLGCVVQSESQDVEVCEDQTTELRVFGPDGERPLTVEFRIGDGSLAQLRSGSGHSDKPEQAKVADLAHEDGPVLKLGAPTPLEPTFRVELVPHPRQPLCSVQSEWIGFDAKDQIVLPDVRPGAYRLSVVQKVDLSVWGYETIYERDIAKRSDSSHSVRPRRKLSRALPGRWDLHAVRPFGSGGLVSRRKRQGGVERDGRW
jgi:hypothetical protein